MEKLKVFIFWVIVLALMGLLGYWAFGTIQSGSEYVSAEKITKLEKDNEDLKKQVGELVAEIAVLKPAVPTVAQRVVEEPLATQKTEQGRPVPTTINKNQSLINELQKLIDDSVVMKKGSRGTRVGTIQEFFNLYNKTKNRIDNDYGASTEKAVINFQKDQGLTADGEADKTLFEKMIAWLEKE